MDLIGHVIYLIIVITDTDVVNTRFTENVELCSHDNDWFIFLYSIFPSLILFHSSSLFESELLFSLLFRFLPSLILTCLSVLMLSIHIADFSHQPHNQTYIVKRWTREPQKHINSNPVRVDDSEDLLRAPD